jgi:hypothetical protein
VLTTLLLEGEGDEGGEDPWRSMYLEVWADEGTSGRCSNEGIAGGGMCAGSSRSETSSAPGSRGRSTTGKASASAASGDELKIRVLAPIKQGQGSKGYDAVLGGPALDTLRVGIDWDAMRLFRKQAKSSFRKVLRRRQQH